MSVNKACSTNYNAVNMKTIYDEKNYSSIH